MTKLTMVLSLLLVIMFGGCDPVLAGNDPLCDSMADLATNVKRHQAAGATQQELLRVLRAGTVSNQSYLVAAIVIDDAYRRPHMPEAQFTSYWRNLCLENKTKTEK